MEDNKLPKKRLAGRLVFSAAALGLSAALFVDNSRLFIKSTVYDVTIPALPPAFSGFRIVQLSDLHGREFGKNSERLIRHVAAQNPDLIVLTGDISDETTDMSVIGRLMPQLTALAPVAFVSGNHEWRSGTIHVMDSILARNGVTYLKNQYLPLERGRERIILCGVEDPESWSDMPAPDEIVSALRLEYPDEPVILLGHQNYWIDKYPDLDVSLILCGHGHGGLVRLPFIGGLFDNTNMRPFPQYECGVYECGSYKMVVSRGMGDTYPLPRFLNTPEIITIILR